MEGAGSGKGRGGGVSVIRPNFFSFSFFKRRGMSKTKRTLLPDDVLWELRCVSFYFYLTAQTMLRLREREGERESSNSKTLFSKDCRLSS